MTTATAPRPRKRRKARRVRKPKKCPVCHMPADRRTAANVVALHGHNWHASCLATLAAEVDAVCPLCNRPADDADSRQVERLGGRRWHTSCLAALVTAEAYEMATRHQQPRPAEPDLLRLFFTP